MERQARGRSFEEALEHWSPPELYDGIRTQIGISHFRLNSAARHRDLSPMTEQIENLLFERLKGGELFSSALADDDSGQRFLVPAETYAASRLHYDWGKREIVGDNLTLREVEVFARNRVPENVFALWEAAGTNTSADRKPQSLARATAFHHDANYRHVRLGDQEFLLTGMQSRIAKALHEAHLAGLSWMHVEQLRSDAGFHTEKLSGLFRRMSNWRDLIKSDGRGHYRLNI